MLKGYVLKLSVNWVLKTKVLKPQVLKRYVLKLCVNWVLKTKVLEPHVLKRFVLKLCVKNKSVKTTCAKKSCVKIVKC